MTTDEIKLIINSIFILMVVVILVHLGCRILGKECGGEMI